MRILLASAFAAAMMAGGAGAEGCTPIMLVPEVDLTPFGLPYYVDNDVVQPEFVASVWVYEETNRIPGLQRGDPVVNDTCFGKFLADTVVAGVYQ